MTPAQSNDDAGKPWSRVTGLPAMGPSWRTNNSCDEPLMARLAPPEIQESRVAFTGGEPSTRVYWTRSGSLPRIWSYSGWAWNHPAGGVPMSSRVARATS